MIEIDQDRIALAPAAAGAAPDRPASPEGLRERKKREKLRRIAEAAAELFARRGFEATTARDVSRRAGIGTGTLFSYVRDKRELLLLVFREDAERVLAGAPRELAPGQPLVAGLLALFGPFVDLYARREDLARLFVRELFFRREDETRGMAALDRELVGRARGLVAEAVARGELRPDLDVERATGVVLAQYAFWIQGWLGPGRWPAQAVRPGLRGSLELVVRGMAAREEETASCDPC